MHGGLQAVLKRTVATYGFPKNLRLVRTEDFGVLLKTRNERIFFVRSRYFSCQGMTTDVPQRLRFGITVGKKNAPRSVDRALIKRILREAARQQAPNLLPALQKAGLGLDVSLRLREPLKSIEGGDAGVRALKAALHEDARHLMASLLERADRKLRRSVS